VPGARGIGAQEPEQDLVAEQRRDQAQLERAQQAVDRVDDRELDLTAACIAEPFEPIVRP
jgi:hypothetical protein